MGRGAMHARFGVGRGWRTITASDVVYERGLGRARTQSAQMCGAYSDPRLLEHEGSISGCHGDTVFFATVQSVGFHHLSTSVSVLGEVESCELFRRTPRSKDPVAIGVCRHSGRSLRGKRAWGATWWVGGAAQLAQSARVLERSDGAVAGKEALVVAGHPARIDGGRARADA